MNAMHWSFLCRGRRSRVFSHRDPGRARGYSEFLHFETLESRLMLDGALAADADWVESSSPSTVAPPSHAPHFGSSPFAPPERTDHTFFVDQAPGLDTGCTFKIGGPLVFNIPVDRVVGDVTTLKANNKISATAQLRMPAYDVDFDGVFPPERDKVFFNGNAVPGEFLTGWNNTWKFNEFDVPIEWVNFPSDATSPAMNTIRIEIDVHQSSSGDRWCTAIDWASLTIEEIAPPVLFVHGIFSHGAKWSTSWESGLDDLGILNDTIDLDQGGLSLDSIEQNAADIAQRITALSNQWGVDSLNIVSHSKGGLDSRHFIEGSDKIDTLIQIGTPNAGSPWANIIAAGVVTLTPFIGTTVIAALAGPALVQLTTPYMALYNSFHNLNPNTRYVSLAGDYTFGGLDIRDGILWGVMGGRSSDSWVPVSSVHALASASHLTIKSTGSDKQAKHTGMVESPRIFDILSGTATTPIVAPSQPLAFDPPASSPTRTSTAAGVVSAGKSSTHSMPVDGAGPFRFSLIHTGGDLAFSLVSPSGIVIDASVANSDPNMGYESFEVTADLRILAYEVSGLFAEPGIWTLTVVGQSVANPIGFEPFFLAAWSESTTIDMDATLDQGFYSSGDTILVTAALADNGQPLAGATVNVDVLLPDGQFHTFLLSDDGNGHDAAAGDGVYTGAFGDTAQAGTYRMVVHAEGTHPEAFAREEFLLAPVAASHSHFTGQFSDRPVDTNGNGLFDQLIIDAAFDATADATYRIIAVLAASDGTVIDETSMAIPLNTAVHVIPLQFDGPTIFESGVDGPYTVSVKVAEEDAINILPLASQIDVHQTVAYDHSEFEHSDIFALGGGEDHGIDLDGNGLFDQLMIRPDVFIETPDDYTWTSRLEDMYGTEIGFASGSGYLTAGVSAISLLFDGETIGSNGVDGPYFVKGLLIYSSSASASISSVYTSGAYEATQFEGAMLPIQIDILPGSNLNRIYPLSYGTVAVAVISTDEFDATNVVDVDSLTFGVSGNNASIHRLLSGEPDFTLKDINDDNLLDLVCQFAARETGFEVGDTEGLLRGRTLRGTPFEGRDSVEVIIFQALGMGQDVFTLGMPAGGIMTALGGRPLAAILGGSSHNSPAVNAAAVVELTQVNESIRDLLSEEDEAVSGAHQYETHVAALDVAIGGVGGLGQLVETGLTQP